MFARDVSNDVWVWADTDVPLGRAQQVRWGHTMISNGVLEINGVLEVDGTVSVE